MNEPMLNLIKKDIAEILDITYPLCKNPSPEVQDTNIKINKLAYEIYIKLDKLKSR
jgi:hypothetical protein